MLGVRVRKVRVEVLDLREGSELEREDLDGLVAALHAVDELQDTSRGEFRGLDLLRRLHRGNRTTIRSMCQNADPVSNPSCTRSSCI